MKAPGWVVVLMLGCGGAAVTPSRPEAAAPALTALAAARFDEAEAAASKVLATDPGNARAAAIRALARYQQAGNALFAAFRRFDSSDRIDLPKHLRSMATDFSDRLAAVDADLAIAERDPTFSMDLCLACWEHDWNHSGEIDDRDLALFQIEVGPDGDELPELDARRKPTFRLDVGDVSWARAMIAFQRAIAETFLAYGWFEAVSEASSLGNEDDIKKVVIKLVAPERMTKARELVLDGLGHAQRCRTAYLAEADDEREWMPNPSQHDHPVPLPVDAAFYDHWGALLGDVRRLFEGSEGLSVAEIAQLGDHRWSDPPTGFIDVSALYRQPADLTVDLEALLDRETRSSGPAMAGVLAAFFGKAYQPAMKPSPLVGRLQRMKSQVSRGEESFERKLRYLLWAN